MTALLTLLVLAAFAYAVHRYAPPAGTALDRLRPDLDSASHYDDLRSPSDLDAVHSRFDPTETPAESVSGPVTAQCARPRTPLFARFKASFS